MRTTTTRVLAAVSTVSLLAGACTDDESSTADLVAYCDLMETLDSQDGPPTADQLTRAKEIRPESVGDAVDTVVDAFLAAGDDIGAAFSDPAVVEALDEMEVHDADACGFDDGEADEDEQVTEPAEGAEVVTISAVDFGFDDVPDQLAAGSVALGLVNDGEAAHEMAVFRVDDGVDVDAFLSDFVESMESGDGPSEDDPSNVGFTFALPGQGPFFVNAELEAGTYLLVCFIPGPGGAPHYELGMTSTLQVVEA